MRDLFMASGEPRVQIRTTLAGISLTSKAHAGAIARELAQDDKTYLSCIISVVDDRGLKLRVSRPI